MPTTAALEQALGNAARSEAGWIHLGPSATANLGGVGGASDAEKRERFVAHLHYAKDRGVLAEVETFLTSLRDEQWHVETT